MQSLEIFVENHKEEFGGVYAKTDRLVVDWMGQSVGLLEFAGIIKNHIVENPQIYENDVEAKYLKNMPNKAISEMLKTPLRKYIIIREIPNKEELVKSKLVRYTKGDGGDIHKVEYVVIDEKGRVTDLSPAHFRITHRIKDFEEAAIPAYPVYHPYMNSGFFPHINSDGNSVQAINTYTPPKWFEYLEDAKPILPKEIEGLFSQIDGDLDRKYFLYFLRKMIWGKNSSYLILQGSGGIGKTTMKSVFKALVGSSNFTTGKNSLFKSVFNSALEDTKLMVFDEAYYTCNEEPFMKELPNPSISIEGKFKNATRETKVFSSFILMNNKEKDNYIAYDARKFCPVKLQTRRLETVITTKEIEIITKKCGDSLNQSDYDPEYIASIAKYLWEKCDYSDLFPQGEYRGPKFWQICRTSMFSWQAAIIDALENPVEYLGQAKGGEIFVAIKNNALTYSFLQNKILQSFKDNKKGRSAPKFPNDYSSARHFLDIYRDLQGKVVYTTKNIPDKYSYDDFFVEISAKEEVRDEDLL